MSSLNLSRGSIHTIGTKGVQDNQYPVVQVTEIKKVSSSSERYVTVISDGEYSHQAMLATQLNSEVHSGRIAKYTVVRLKEFVLNSIQNHRVLILIQLEVLDNSQTNVIGEPIPFAEDGSKPEPTTNHSRNSNDSMKQEYKSQEDNSFDQRLPTRYDSNNSNNNNFRGKSEPISRINNFNSNNIANTQEFHPIADLNPYQNRWTIKARVTNKQAMRSWTNQKGTGKLFSFDLLDAAGGQIRVTMFNDQATQKYDQIEVNRVYILSRGTLKLANSKFNTLPHQYEITFNNDSIIQMVEEDSSIESQRFDFVPFDKLPLLQDGKTIDVIGIVENVGDLSVVRTRETQKDLNKRVVSLVDMTNNSVEVTVWGENAEKYDQTELGNNVVLAIKACKLSTYAGGKTLSTTFGSQFNVSPDINQAAQLKFWYQSNKPNSFHNLSAKTASTDSAVVKNESGSGAAGRLLWNDVESRNLGSKSTADYFSFRGTILFCKGDYEKPPWYLACPNRDCKSKKVTSQDDSRDAHGHLLYHCSSCGKAVQPEPRYILSMNVGDFTGGSWATAFNESAMKILGNKPAKDLAQLKELGQQSAFSQVFQQANFREYIFKMRISTDQQATGDGSLRKRAQIISVADVDYKTELPALIDLINKY